MKSYNYFIWVATIAHIFVNSSAFTIVRAKACVKSDIISKSQQKVKITKEFYFPFTSYKSGLQNIHKIEYLQSIENSNYLKIQSTSEPVSYGKYIIISAKCNVKHKYNNEIKVFSNQSNVSHIVVCSRDGTPQITLKLKVKPSFFGHILSIDATTYAKKRYIFTLIKPLWNFLYTFEMLSFWLYNIKYNDNLIKYRIMIFNNTNEDNEEN